MAPTESAISREQFLEVSMACEAMAGIPKALAALAKSDSPIEFRTVLDSIRDHRAKWAAVREAVEAQLVEQKTPVDECNGAEDISAHHTADALAWLAFCRVCSACDNWSREANDSKFADVLLGNVAKFDSGLVLLFWNQVRAAFDDWPTFSHRKLNTQIRRERVAVAAGLQSKPAGNKSGKEQKSINQRMIEHVESNRDAIYWTARQWATFLGIKSPGHVTSQRAWKDCANTRALTMVERECKGQKTDRRRKPKASDINSARDGDD